jgi:EAL domain-containing protein (putative c-di-GMP-specific phosphodiesterase class I)
VINEIASVRRPLDRDAIQGYLTSKPMPPAASQPVARNVVLREA